MKNYRYYKLPKLSLYFLLLFNFGMANSGTNDRTEILAGLAVLYFDYQEFNQQNVLLDKEQGTLPLITVVVTRWWQDWSFEMGLSRYRNVVAYTGQTQGGTPVTTNTEADTVDYSVVINRWFAIQDKMRFSVFFGYGQFTWQRNIRSTVTTSGLAVAGLNEQYRWDYIKIGSKIVLRKKPKTQWLFNIHYNQMIAAQIDIDFKGFGGYDSTTLDLGKQFGLRLSSSYQYNINSQLIFELLGYYDYWELSRSDSKRLNINGIPSAAAVAEPRSEMRILGLRFALIKIF